MAEIVFSPEAGSDLIEMKKYISEELMDAQAAKTISGIIKRIRMLSDFPESGAELSSIISIESNYRFLVCGNYIAFYRYERGRVHIVRILYAKRDYMRILFE